MTGEAIEQHAFTVLGEVILKLEFHRETNNQEYRQNEDIFRHAAIQKLYHLHM